MTVHKLSGVEDKVICKLLCLTTHFVKNHYNSRLTSKRLLDELKKWSKSARTQDLYVANNPNLDYFRVTPFYLNSVTAVE